MKYVHSVACFVFSCETGLLFIRFLITWVETYKLDTLVLVGSANYEDWNEPPTEDL